LTRDANYADFANPVEFGFGSRNRGECRAAVSFGRGGGDGGETGRGIIPGVWRACCSGNGMAAWAKWPRLLRLALPRRFLRAGYRARHTHLELSAMSRSNRNVLIALLVASGVAFTSCGMPMLMLAVMID
jgi:hypothetical protein